MGKDSAFINRHCCTGATVLILAGLLLALMEPELAVFAVGEARTWHLDGMP